MTVNATVPQSPCACKSEMVSIRRDDVDRLRESVQAMRGFMNDEVLMGAMLPMDAWVSLDRIARFVELTENRSRHQDAPLSIYEPPPVEAEFHPSPEDEAWVAGNPPPPKAGTPEWLLDAAATGLASRGLDPRVRRTSIDFEANGNEWSLELHDMTAFYRHHEDVYDREFVRQSPEPMYGYE